MSQNGTGFNFKGDCQINNHVRVKLNQTGRRIIIFVYAINHILKGISFIIKHMLKTQMR